MLNTFYPILCLSSISSLRTSLIFPTELSSLLFNQLLVPQIAWQIAYLLTPIHGITLLLHAHTISVTYHLKSPLLKNFPGLYPLGPTLRYKALQLWHWVRIWKCKSRRIFQLAHMKFQPPIVPAVHHLTSFLRPFLC
jgi:hypothetical protein